MRHAMLAVPFACSLLIAAGVAAAVERRPPPGGVPFDVLGSFTLDDARFYAAVDVSGGSDGPLPLVVAGGQAGTDRHAGCLVLLRPRGTTFDVAGRHDFTAVVDGKPYPTRIRALVTVPWNDALLVVATGRAGKDDDGNGFVHVCRLAGTTFTEGVTLPVRPLDGFDYAQLEGVVLADVDRDGRRDVVVGGFAGTESAYGSDVRVLELDGAGIPRGLRPLFDGRAAPVRLNALEAADVDGDGNDDILLAGRSFCGSVEKSSLAVWTGDTPVFLSVGTMYASRLRAIHAYTPPGETRPLVLVGGRHDRPFGWALHMSSYRLVGRRLEHVATYEYPTATFIRLRRLTTSPDGSCVLGIGRHCLDSSEDGRWKAFVAAFTVDDHAIAPRGRRHYWMTDFETRVRSLHVTSTGSVLTSGFVRDDRHGRNRASVDVFAVETPSR